MITVKFSEAEACAVADALRGMAQDCRDSARSITGAGSDYARIVESIEANATMLRDLAERIENAEDDNA